MEKFPPFSLFTSILILGNELRDFTCSSLSYILSLCLFVFFFVCFYLDTGSQKVSQVSSQLVIPLPQLFVGDK